jgi:hypothetical protein
LWICGADSIVVDSPDSTAIAANSGVVACAGEIGGIQATRLLARQPSFQERVGRSRR